MNIFLSYNRHSQPVVKSLAADIEAMGHEVWFDHQLSGGRPWWEQILSKVRECSVFVFVLDPVALNSTACKREWGYAAVLGKPILPILVAEGVSTNLLPPALSEIEFVDYRAQDREAVFRLARAMNNLPPAAALPDPLPAPPDAPISYLGSLGEKVDVATLNYEEQSALVVDLKQGLRDEATSGDAETLLRKLRKRRDLFATIAEEIDELLGSAKKAIPPPPSPPPVQPKPNVLEPPVRSIGSLGILNETTDSHQAGGTRPVALRWGAASEHTPTIRERLTAAAIGAGLGVVFGSLGRNYDFGPFIRLVPPALSLATAGAISGLNRTRLIVSAVGLVLVVVIDQSHLLSWYLQIWYLQIWFGFVPVPMAAIIGIVIERVRRKRLSSTIG